MRHLGQTLLFNYEHSLYIESEPANADDYVRIHCFQDWAHGHAMNEELRVRPRILPAASPYRDAIKLALTQQGAVLLLASMILDGGYIFDFCLIAFIAFWTVVGLIRWRRPHAPTKLDLIFIQ